MKRAIALAVPMTVTLLLLGCAFAAPTVSAQADAPVWQEGDRWAMGKEMDISTALGDVEDITDMLETMGVTVHELSLDGVVESWIVFEVVDVTDTEYNLSVDLGAKMAAEAHVGISAQLPQAGTYSASEFASAPTEQKRVDVDLVEDFGLVIDGSVIFEKSTLAVKSVSLVLQASAVVNLDATNIPSIESSASQIVVSYQNYNIDATFDLDLAVSVVFSPSLNLYDFPLDVGDAWVVESTATVSGTIDGFLDVKGLPAELKDEILTDEFVEQTGITDFPIEFDQISAGEEGVGIENGVIQTFEVPIYAEMECTSKITRTVFGLGEVDVYKIVVNHGEGQYYYSDGFRFMSGMGVDLSGADLPELPGELPGGLIPEADMEMETVNPDTASSHVASVASYQADLSGEATGTGGGLGIDPMILAIIIVVVVAVIAVALVFVLKRKKP